MNETATLWWNNEKGSLFYIDQTLLPGSCTIAECRSTDELAAAIRRLGIRGAPALGVAGAFGIALATRTCNKTDPAAFFADVHRAAGVLKATRPTAVNLGWGIDRVLAGIAPLRDIPSIRRVALAEAEAVAREDTASCHAIGTFGAALLPGSCTVLTHCNAGALACSSWGTALGVIRSAVNLGKQVRVIACETRPLLQGARLTAWELARDGIDVTVIPDSAAAYLMRKGSIDAVIVGADRITRDAVFNKIGTYMHAVCARYHDIPFYTAAPLSTIDAGHREEEIMIEERCRNEVTTLGDRVVVPVTAGVKNYAFDATPMDLITAVITEHGVVHPPVSIDSILSLKNRQ